MVFEIKGNQQLSQTNVKTMKQRCVNLITQAACIDQIRTEVIQPVLEYYSQQSPPKTLADDAVFLSWMLLRQGTMLCYILNNFRSGILESFSLLKKPISESVFTDDAAKANIKLFLAACKGDLYMTEDQLFPQASLYTDDTNTLSKAMAMTDSFFTRIGRIQGLNYPKKFEEIAKSNPVFSLEMPHEETTKSSGSLDLRLRVTKELLDTEQQYIADLDKLQSYAEELRMDEIITPESHTAIFSNLNAICDFQRRFLLQMEAKLTKSALTDLTASYAAGIGKLFIDNQKGFSVYEIFCPNQTRADETITIEVPQLMSKANILDPNVTLRAYMIKPLQRLCKYPLLIRELMKQSAPDATDRKELEEAWAICDQITGRVNEKNREQENAVAAHEMISLVKEWPKGLPKDKIGKLLMHGGASVNTGDGYKELSLYLFEHVMMIVGQSKSVADYFTAGKRLSKHQLVIKRAIVPEKMISALETKCPIEGTMAVNVKYWMGQATDGFIFKQPSDDRMKKWIVAINNCILKNKPKEELNITPKERRRLSLMTAAGLPPPASAANVAKVTTNAPVVEEEELEPLRLKIFYNDDIFVTALYVDVATLVDLKRHSLAKIQSCHKLLNRQFNLVYTQVTVKYYDGQRDLISLLDDTDLDAALTFSPNELAVRIFHD